MSGDLLDALPGVHQLKLVCEGVAALQDGDPLKALQIASDLAPVPGVQSALKGASAAAATGQKLSQKE